MAVNRVCRKCGSPGVAFYDDRTPRTARLEQVGPRHYAHAVCLKFDVPPAPRKAGAIDCTKKARPKRATRKIWHLTKSVPNMNHQCGELVVRATTAKQARQLAAKADPENAKAWLSPIKSNCCVLSPRGKDEVLIQVFYGE